MLKLRLYQPDKKNRRVGIDSMDNVPHQANVVVYYLKMIEIRLFEGGLGVRFVVVSSFLVGVDDGKGPAVVGPKVAHAGHHDGYHIGQQVMQVVG